MTTRLTQLALQALDKWGEDTQILKAVCELNELSLALLHYREGKVSDEEVNKKLDKLENKLNQD